MEDSKLRLLEQRFKLRVKTGCETCRIRKVKCDEAKPACLRCTKTGRKCDGYANTTKPRSKHATAASYRNSSFLVVPQRPKPPSNTLQLLRPIPQTLLSNARESSSFLHFTSTTLPSWTQFFDSPLWTQTILQLSHQEPAIKHGILALSEMHQRFTQHRPVFTTRSDDFAFIQYSQAVQHSNALLQRFSASAATVGVETVLVACILFTCFENLAGRYDTANMHLRNGLRILAQHQRERRRVGGAEMGHVESVLGRFDLQAMTFSDDKAPYEYVLETPPECPRVSERYVGNEAARDELVGLLRCVMWSWGVLEEDGRAEKDPECRRITRDVVGAFEAWEARFAEFESGYLVSGTKDPKIDAGNALLNMCAVMMRVVMQIMKSEFEIDGEMAWDSHLEDFRKIVELAETLPGFRAEDEKNTGAREGIPVPQRHRPLAPKTSMLSPAGTDTVGVDSDSTASTRAPSPRIDTLTSFSPSFELSPIVPLFLTAHRCRDPHLRRRAIRLLLRSRRRDGVWDSFAAGLVGAEAMQTEEASPRRSFGDEDFLALTPGVKECADVPLYRRVSAVCVSVSIAEGRIETTLKMVGGTNVESVVGFA